MKKKEVKREGVVADDNDESLFIYCLTQLRSKT